MLYSLGCFWLQITKYLGNRGLGIKEASLHHRKYFEAENPGLVPWLSGVIKKYMYSGSFMLQLLTVWLPQLQTLHSHPWDKRMARPNLSFSSGKERHSQIFHHPPANFPFMTSLTGQSLVTWLFSELPQKQARYLSFPASVLWAGERMQRQGVGVSPR